MARVPRKLRNTPKSTTPIQDEVVFPTAPMNVVKTEEGFKTENVIDQKARVIDGSLRTYVGNMATQQNNKDVIANSQYTYEFRILEQYLENVYQQSWIAKRIVELPVELAMMNGFNLTLKNKNDEKKFWGAWNKYELDDLIIDTQKWADVYGSSIILFKNKNQDPEKKYTNYNSLDFIQVQYPFYTPMPKTDDVYETDRVSFNLLGMTAILDNMAVFHGTKSIKRLSPQFKYFGMSVYQNMWKAMISDDLITTAVANMIYRSSTPVYKIEGYKELLRTKRLDLILEALQTTELTRGMFGAVVQDVKDDFKMVGQSITALADLDRRSAERLCGAIGYPATMILGKSPDGQNSTGKSDEKNTILTIKRYQKKMLKPVKSIALSLIRHLGIDETDWDLEFNNPHSQDKQEKATTDSLELDNAMKLQQLKGNEDIVNRYLKQAELITEEEFNELDKVAGEFNENNRLENEAGNVPTDKNTK